MIDKDAWKRIADWLAERSILAPVRGAAAFREHVVDVMAKNAVWRFHERNDSLPEVLASQAESGWLAFLPDADRDALAREAWKAMADRLAGALLDLECIQGRI